MGHFRGLNGDRFPITVLWIVTILGAAYFLHLAISEMGRKSLYIGSWLAWTIKVSIVVFWFWSTYPISWLPLEAAKSQILAIGITWVAAAITIGLCGPVVVSGVRLLESSLRIIRLVQCFYLHR